MTDKNKEGWSDQLLESNRDRLAEMQDRKHTYEMPGANKPDKKTLRKLDEDIQKQAQEIGEEFMRRYTALCQMAAVEIRAEMLTDPKVPTIARAMTVLRPYRKKKEAKMKAWHEAMADNLHMRANCEHVLNEEGTACEKCGLNPENWGQRNGKPFGVTDAYREKITKKIEEEKAKAEEETGE